MSHTENISKLEQFIKMMTGHFDNQEQFQKMKEAGEIYPYAEHVNTPCNNKIQDLPADFPAYSLWKKVIIKAKENVILRHICFC